MLNFSPFSTNATGLGVLFLRNMEKKVFRNVFCIALLGVMCILSVYGTNAQKVVLYPSPNPEEGGTVTCVDSHGKSYKWGDTIEPGNDVTFTVTPNPGFEIELVEVNNEEYQASDNTLGKILKPNGVAVITVTVPFDIEKLRCWVQFKPTSTIKKYKVEFTQPAPAMGRIEVLQVGSAQQVASGDILPEGTEINVTVYINEGYLLETLKIGSKLYTSGDFEVVDNATSVRCTVNEPTVIEASFVNRKKQARLTIDPLVRQQATFHLFNEAGEKLTEPILLPLGSNITIRVTPKDGYTVKSILVGKAIFTGSELKHQPDGAAYITYRVKEDIQISAEIVSLEKKHFAVNFAFPNEVASYVKVTRNGVVISSGATCNEGDRIVCVLQENDEFVARWWRVNGLTYGMGQQMFVLTMPNESVTIELVYKKSVVHTVTFDNVVTGGALGAYAEGRLIESGTRLQEGTQIRFQPVPYEGYKLGDWYINGVKDEENKGLDPYLIYLGKDIHVRCTFEPINSAITEVNATPLKVCISPNKTISWQPQSDAENHWTVVLLNGAVCLAGTGNSLDGTLIPKGTYLLVIGSHTQLIVL